ncbi:MAG: HTH domain-containing protein [Pseudomonadota bacterium]
MRASRLLQILLLLQNRGRMTSRQLADEVEVTPRTILRDLDALTDAGLPVIVHQGRTGGIELGFQYRTRLTGLAEEEAEAIALVLTRPQPELEALGLDAAARRACRKMIEAFPDATRARIAAMTKRFQIEAESAEVDPRVPALAKAVRERRIVRLNAKSASPRIVHPVQMLLGADNAALVDQKDSANPIPFDAWGDVNISAKRFVLDH